MDAAPDTGSMVQLGKDIFRAISSTRKLLVVFDDLHWADPSTFMLVRSLDQLFRGSPAILIATYREEEPTRSLRHFLGELQHTGRPEQIRLEPLSTEEASAMAEGVLGVLPSNFDEYYARSGGNPFFLEELVATGVDRLPAAVRDVVLAGLHRLSADAVRVVEAASLETNLSPATGDENSDDLVAPRIRCKRG